LVAACDILTEFFHGLTQSFRLGIHFDAVFVEMPRPLVPYSVSLQSTCSRFIVFK
jgi:hypothetical protein